MSTTVTVEVQPIELVRITSAASAMGQRPQTPDQLHLAGNHGHARTPPHTDTEQSGGVIDDDHTHTHEFSLPPVDRGKEAWLFLAACFMVEALVWGFPFAFGVFQNYYSTHEPFAGSRNIAVIGTCSMGIMYLILPLIISAHRFRPRLMRHSTIVGLFLMCLSLSLSSFSANTTHLIVTQGVFYAIGGSLAYMPCILYLPEWFVARQGLAYGVMWSGTGLAGVFFPLFLESLLVRVGWQNTLRIWACMLFAFTAPLAAFIKPRVPITSASHSRPFSLRFIFARPFALHQAANVVEALGFFLPGLYLPSYATVALGASNFLAALTVLLLNVASVFGCIAMGAIIDRLHVSTCILLSTAGATIGVLLLWGLATSLPTLYAFCVVYGFFAGSYTSAWPGIMKDVTRRDAAARQEGGTQGQDDDHHRHDGGRRKGGGVDPMMVFGMLSFGRGVGNVISGPVSEALLSEHAWKDELGAGYGTGYGTLIVFTGVTALLGGASALWKHIRWL